MTLIKSLFSRPSLETEMARTLKQYQRARITAELEAIEAEARILRITAKIEFLTNELDEINPPAKVTAISL